ncbi:MAG TPA: type II toxin-antitoxin system PemK/MazF family toxin [Xanthomonadaceae bacterium]|nr:type II toxin-antitoxin system PemK/MazF family toxin [Xanthomonadaceae bacterium]
MLDAGSLVVLPFPFSDLRATKRRPVLLLTAPDGHGDFLAMAVTSQAGHPEAIPLNQLDMRSGTLPKASWIRTDKVVSLNRALVAKEVGRVSATVRLQAVHRLCARLNA